MAQRATHSTITYIISEIDRALPDHYRFLGGESAEKNFVRGITYYVLRGESSVSFMNALNSIDWLYVELMKTAVEVLDIFADDITGARDRLTELQATSRTFSGNLVFSA